MDMVAQGTITTNFIEPSYELVNTWNGYWNTVMPIDQRSSMAYPFHFLSSDGFWKLKDNPSYQGSQHVKSINSLREKYLGASINEELFQLIQIQDPREKLRAVLVNTYFSPKVQPKVIEQGYVNLASYKYSQSLIKQEIAEQTSLFGNDIEPAKKEKVRDAGFRKAIVSLYEHRCALCGIRMLTPEGHTIVEAAHIVPWSETKDDRPTNGLCLCRLCHWSFDEGLMSVGSKYEVLVSKRVQSERNMPGHVLTLVDRPIFKPDEEVYWPSQENLAMHRKGILK
jgi:putative restriction endonuclease